MATIKLFDKEYELVCTVDALSELTKDVNGSVDAVGDLLANGTTMEQLETGVKYLHTFMKAAADRKRVRAMMLGEEISEEHLPSFEELKMVITLTDLPAMMEAITATIGESQARQVEDKAPKKTQAE